MVLSLETGSPVTEPAHPTELYHALIRLKEEHSTIKQAIFQLEERAKAVIRSCDAEAQVQTLRSLRQETILLIAKLEEHSVWEEQILYPFLNDYFHMSMDPSIIPSFWVLEKDHELAKAYLDAFTDLSEALAYSDDQAKIVGTAEHLTQACHILKGHLHMQEEMVYPLTEQILTDVDYFFS